MTDWISVKDRKPTPKVTVLAVVGVGNRRHIEMVCYGHTRNSKDWWSVTHNNVLPGWMVSHWMPMPELPPEVEE